MPERTIAFAHTVVLVLAALLPALLLAVSELTVPISHGSAVVWITEDDGSSDSERVAASIEEMAREQGTTVGFAVSDVHEPDSLWHLYLAVGEPDSQYATWLEDGYPSFGRTVEVRTHPMAELGEHGPRGYYIVLGPSEDEAALVAALADHGLGQVTGSREARLSDLLFDGPLFHVSVVGGLVVLTASGAGVLLGSRGYAVQRLQGRSYGEIFWRDLRRIVRLWGMILPGVAALTLIFLGLYNGWNQLDHFATVAAVILGVFTAIALTTHALVLAIVHTTAIPPALKGWIPARTTLVGAYLVRGLALFLVLGVLSSVVHLTQTTRRQQAALEIFEDVGDTSAITLSGSTGTQESEVIEEHLGPWLREADEHGDLILAEQQRSEAVLPHGTELLDLHVLVVNDTYLTEHEVLNPEGMPHTVSEDGTFRVLLPQKYAHLEKEILQGLSEWLLMYTEKTQAEYDIEVLPNANEQSLFTYGSRLPGQTPSQAFLHDPVVIAVPDGTVLTDQAYVDFMTHGAIVFPDPDVVDRARSDPRTAEYVNTVPPIRDKAIAEHAEQITMLRVESINLFASAMVLLLTGVAACVIHVRTRGQAVFVRHISGWTFPAIHRRFLLLEVAVALGFTSWATWDTLLTLKAMKDPAMHVPPSLVPTTGAEPFHAITITVAGLALTLGALVVFHRSTVREEAARD